MLLEYGKRGRNVFCLPGICDRHVTDAITVWICLVPLLYLHASPPVKKRERGGLNSMCRMLKHNSHLAPQKHHTASFSTKCPHTTYLLEKCSIQPEQQQTRENRHRPKRHHLPRMFSLDGSKHNSLVLHSHEAHRILTSRLHPGPAACPAAGQQA